MSDTIDSEPGISLWAELKATLGDLTKSVQERNRQAAKAAEQPVFSRFQGAAVAANGVAVITSNLGSPSQGYTWNVRNLAVGGVTPTTAAAGRADIFATASDMRTPFLIGNLGLTDWRDQSAALPNIFKYSEGELFLRNPEELIVVISGATNGQQYVIAGTIQQVQESAKQQAWMVLMRLMYDAVNSSVSKIPPDAEIVAGYINGRYQWNQKDWDRFPDAIKVRILVYIPGMAFVDDGLVLDVEAGDAPSQAARKYAADWVHSRIRAGVEPVIYTSKSGLRYLGGLPCQFWIADPTDTPHLLPGTVATQYAYKGVYDISVVSDGWLPASKGTSSVPAPNAPCTGFTPTPTDKGYWLVGSDGGVFAFGDAGFFGSLGDKKLNAPIIGMKVTSTGKGYWLFAEDYGVFAFGDAEYLGHPGA